MPDLVLAEDRGPVRHLVLNRPDKRNALNLDLALAIRHGFRDAADDPSVRVVVLRGAGRVFSAGMDVAALAGAANDLGPFRRACLEAFNLAEEMPKPVVAQIHGACLGGALELALACDLRVFAEDAVAGLIETRLGLIPDLGGSSRLPQVVGVGRAKELIMTGRFLGGEEALQIGFANRIAPADELDAATQALCDELLGAAPMAVSLAKGIIDRAAKPALDETLVTEGEAQARLLATDDFAEGASAVMEKRQPEFAGR
jgi:enoyl-CoA hydratase/carnithine racemase